MLNELLTYLLGGGLVSVLIGVLTLRYKVRKVKAETEAANLVNMDTATRILMENIVEPLTASLNTTREELEATKREMRRLRRAINEANHCRYNRDCPVLEGMMGDQRDVVEA